MTTVTRLAVSLLAALSLLLGVGVLAHWCMGFDFGLKSLSSLAEENERRAALTRQTQAMATRNKEKQRVVERVVARQVTLAQAIAEFRRIHE
jgi:Tfp pilus assembly protein PilN